MKKLALAVLALHLVVVPCMADVIPSRHDTTDPGARKAVESRLTALGVSAAEAQRHVDRMTPDDVACFGARPERVQPAAGLYWYEWLGGLGMVGFGVLMYAIAVSG